MTQMNSVVHFEMPYDDRKRVANFYRDAFGWQTRMLGEEMGNYVIATTTETDESGPKRPGAINGGFFARNPTGRRSIHHSSSPSVTSRPQ
jgi:predicted enzyme related to lactoylglutathione lyase